MKKSIILFLILSISLSANAAEYTNENTRPCPQDKALVCSLKNKPITGVLKRYYYVWGGKAGIRFEENYQNGKLDGLRKTYYGNGNLEAEENYKNGKLDGLRKTYYSNGNLDSESNYKAGKKEGPVKTYYENGNLKEEFIFKEGKAISGFIYNEYDQKRKMTDAHLYNSSSK